MCDLNEARRHELQDRIRAEVGFGSRSPVFIAFSHVCDTEAEKLDRKLRLSLKCSDSAGDSMKAKQRQIAADTMFHLHFNDEILQNTVCTCGHASV